MGMLEKMVFGVLLFSMFSVVLSNFYINTASVYSLTATNISPNTSQQYETIDSLSVNLSAEREDEPTSGGLINEILDIIGVLFNSGIDMVKMLANVGDLITNNVYLLASYIGIDSEVLKFIMTAISLLVSFAIIRALLGRGG